MNLRYKKLCRAGKRSAAKLLHYSRKTGNMKKYSQLSLLLVAMMVSLSSCELIGDIFQAGFWTAIVLIVIVIIIIIWIVNRFRR